VDVVKLPEDTQKRTRQGQLTQPRQHLSNDLPVIVSEEDEFVNELRMKNDSLPLGE